MAENKEVKMGGEKGGRRRGKEGGREDRSMPKRQPERVNRPKLKEISKTLLEDLYIPRGSSLIHMP